MKCAFRMKYSASIKVFSSCLISMTRKSAKSLQYLSSYLLIILTTMIHYFFYSLPVTLIRRSFNISILCAPFKPVNKIQVYCFKIFSFSEKYYVHVWLTFIFYPLSIKLRIIQKKGREKGQRKNIVKNTNVYKCRRFKLNISPWIGGWRGGKGWRGLNMIGIHFLWML